MYVTNKPHRQEINDHLRTHAPHLPQMRAIGLGGVFAFQALANRQLGDVLYVQGKGFLNDVGSQ